MESGLIASASAIAGVVLIRCAVNNFGELLSRSLHLASLYGTGTRVV